MDGLRLDIVVCAWCGTGFAVRLHDARGTLGHHGDVSSIRVNLRQRGGSPSWRRRGPPRLARRGKGARTRSNDRASLRCEIFPSDLNATVAFYGRVLRFRIIRDERGTPYSYVALERGEVRLGAARSTRDPAPRVRPPVGIEPVLEVDHLDQERARVAAAGWPVIEDVTLRPWGLRDFRLLDPEGHYWRITTHAADT